MHLRTHFPVAFIRAFFRRLFVNNSQNGVTGAKQNVKLRILGHVKTVGNAFEIFISRVSVGIKSAEISSRCYIYYEIENISWI